MPADIGTMLTLRETARRIGATYDIIWYLISEGELNGHRLGGEWYVSERDLQQFLERLADSQPSAAG